MSVIPDTAYVHPLASQMGDVEIGDYASLWPGSSIRGDFSPIRVGVGTSIQDCCVLHSTPTDRVRVGNYVTVGHGAVLHGCTVEDECIIGMNATLLDRSVIGRGSIIAAGAVITAGTQVPPGSFAAGVPAEIKPGRPGQEDRTRASALAYIALSQNYKKGGQSITPEELIEKIKEVEEAMAGRQG
jgi:carbonic anhydrase/acetyltransferase-like protein (isoleucine patch superfamily)